MSEAAVFAGIDVSKAGLEVAVGEEGWSVSPTTRPASESW